MAVFCCCFCFGGGGGGGGGVGGGGGCGGGDDDDDVFTFNYNRHLCQGSSGFKVAFCQVCLCVALYCVLLLNVPNLLHGKQECHCSTSTPLSTDCCSKD